MVLNIENSWQELFNEEIKKEYFQRLIKKLIDEKKTYIIYPEEKQLFSAFDLCDFENLKVVIIGQDPYHGRNQAHGLSFSVPYGVKSPPSLLNIFKELKSDLNITIPNHGNLEEWAKQGVLLLNTVLTVRAGEAGSHQKIGWEEFTDSIIKEISNKKKNIVFFLWGSFAHKKDLLIDNKNHLIIKSAHPSPLARGAFFGSKPFSKCNNYLKSNGIKEIDWNSINKQELKLF